MRKMPPVGDQELVDACNRVTARENAVTGESPEAMIHHVRVGLEQYGVGDAARKAIGGWVDSHVDNLRQGALDATPCGHPRCVLKAMFDVVFEQGMISMVEVLRARGFGLEFETAGEQEVSRLEEWLNGEGHGG